MPANPNFSLQGWVARGLNKAASILDGNDSDPRGLRENSYSEMAAFMAMLGERQLADEGCLVSAGMTPSQTALQLGLSAAFAATAAALVIKNNAVAGSGLRLSLREIHFLCAVPPTSGTSLLYATAIDQGDRTPTTVALVAAPATATAYLASVNAPNYASPLVGPLPSVWFPLSTAAGAPPAVPAAKTAQFIVGNGNLRSVIPVGAAASGVQDDYRLVFGAEDRANGASLRSAAGASQIIEPHPAVSLDPQAFFLMYLWCPGNITAGFAFAGLDVLASLR